MQSYFFSVETEFPLQNIYTMQQLHVNLNYNDHVDDILITENGPINLSAGAPRHWEAIEAMMQKDSPLSNYNLPALSN